MVQIRLLVQNHKPGLKHAKRWFKINLTQLKKSIVLHLISMVAINPVKVP